MSLDFLCEKSCPTSCVELSMSYYSEPRDLNAFAMCSFRCGFRQAH